MKSYKVFAITSNDDEVHQLNQLGLDIKVKDGSQTETKFTVLLSDEQAHALQQHNCVVWVKPV